MDSINPSIIKNPRTLQDVSKSGRERPWKKHKEQSQELAKAFRRLGEEYESKAQRCADCGGWLEFVACPNGHEKRLRSANFCKVRLCPMCAWRRSLATFHQLNQIVHEASKRQKMRFIFLTLTTRNVQGNELSKTLDKLFQAWQRLSQRKAFRDVVIGWFRALEVTRNDRRFSNWYGTYHPHFHVLLAVKPSYFTRLYIKQAEWVELWRKSLRVDFTPIVDVRAVKPKRKGQTVEAAVAESGKYAVKPDDYIIKGNQEETDEAVRTFDGSLKNRRLVAYGGLFREIRKELQLVDPEEADLVHIDEESEEPCNCSVCQSEMMKEVYRWHIGLSDYILHEEEEK